eukprot:TRINITY_DN7064_c0_g1_i1.p1 TRINITY_DN7064_c0_g1~~TRINITY_DN7064_c0_g1_i1.p1  ORF type:complete len:145 (+),score=9.31 TRINITY_DN7064_c0_g1_i1:364-798(+)
MVDLLLLQSQEQEHSKPGSTGLKKTPSGNPKSPVRRMRERDPLLYRAVNFFSCIHLSPTSQSFRTSREKSIEMIACYYYRRCLEESKTTSMNNKETVVGELISDLIIDLSDMAVCEAVCKGSEGMVQCTQTRKTHELNLSLIHI